MSVLVKGMKMPKDCPMCPCAHWDKNILTGCELVWRYVPDSETAYWQSDKRPDWCPLVEVPTPHGWLIDADALMHEFAEFVRASNNSDFADVPTWNDAVSLLGSAPAIIEAEEGSGHQMAAITRRGEPHRRDGRQGGAP